MAINKKATCTFFKSNTSKDKSKAEVFGLNFLEPLEKGPRQCPTRSPAKPTYTPRNDGDVGFPDVDY